MAGKIQAVTLTFDLREVDPEDVIVEVVDRLIEIAEETAEFVKIPEGHFGRTSVHVLRESSLTEDEAFAPFEEGGPEAV